VCGHDLGEYCFIGAGCVVLRGALPHELLVGNPARRLGFVCVCGERLGSASRPVCATCGRGYVIDSDGCRQAGV
jgi:UDP-2-acetamido-3-amino-2,3-dideoxy-glucuronate N-acetyltransferase